jgi:hypothetical protein
MFTKGTTMSRSCSLALRTMAVGFALSSPAFGDRRSLRDDQIPYGPNGTIGRGTDSAGVEGAERSGIKLFGSGSRNLDPGHTGFFFTDDDIPRPHSKTATARPYLTNQCYQPGDGYRYPLYYNPATRTYFYYPARP